MGEVVKIFNWSTPSTKESSYRDWEIAWITPRDLSNFNWIFISRGERNITELWFKNSSTQLLPKHTVLFSSRAPIGYVVIANNELTTNQWFKNIVCDEIESHYKFFYYLLKYKANYIESLSSWSTFSEASTSLMRSISISLPPLPEQQAIASLLSSFDDKIELLREQNKTLETLGQTIFQEWFGKYSVDEPESLPKGWRVHTLGEVSNITAGGDKPKNSTDYKTDKNTVPIYSNGISNDGLYWYTDCAKIHEESVTISARWTIWYVSLRQEPYVPIVRLVAIIPNTQYLSSKYLFLWLKNQNITGTGTTQQQLTIPDFSKTRIIIPKIDIMNRFTILLDDLYRKISDNNYQIKSLSTSRDALLPKLMSGEVRVEF